VQTFTILDSRTARHHMSAQVPGDDKYQAIAHRKIQNTINRGQKKIKNNAGSAAGSDRQRWASV
jgi:hypothetical protein